jgi:hypothetical protein
VTDRQYDESAFQAALDFIRSREVDRVGQDTALSRLKQGFDSPGGSANDFNGLRLIRTGCSRADQR